MEPVELTDYKAVFRTDCADRTCTLRVPVHAEPDSAAAMCRLLGELLRVENQGEPAENGHIMQEK